MRAPFLAPIAASQMAPAVAPPAIHPMSAAPGGILYNLHLRARRMSFEKFTVIGDASQASRLDPFERKGQRHFAVRMMMPVNLPIGDNVNQLASSAIARVSRQQPLDELFAIVKQPLIRDGLRHRAVVEKQAYRFTRWKI